MAAASPSAPARSAAAAKTGGAPLPARQAPGVLGLPLSFFELPPAQAGPPQPGPGAKSPLSPPSVIAPAQGDRVSEETASKTRQSARLEPSRVLPDTTDMAGKPLRTSAGRLYFAWLGSMRTTAGARRLVEELRAAYPDVLEGAAWAFKRVDLEDKGRWYRVLARLGDSLSAARATCRRVKDARPDAFCLPLSVDGES